MRSAPLSLADARSRVRRSQTRCRPMATGWGMVRGMGGTVISNFYEGHVIRRAKRRSRRGVIRTHDSKSRRR